MKKYVGKEYADIVLQLAWKYRNENYCAGGGRMYNAMCRTLETMDKYAANINRMGYMMYSDSIDCMLEYLRQLRNSGCEFTETELQRMYDHLSGL